MSKNKILFNYSRLLIGFGLFVFVLSVYISALATSIYPGDNPDTITAAVTLGIPHPPGYPLYTLIGHLFTKIPLMSLAWRVNFMSAVFSALTVMVIYFILLKITKKILPALFGSLMLAFAYRYFQESLYADYLSLSNLLMSSQILILLFWRETKKEKYLYLFTLFFGLSVSHHQVVILLLPAYLYFIYVTDKNIYNNWQVVLKGSLFFLIGLLPFLYLYLRGLSHPIYSWQDTSTLSGVWNIITRKDYSGNDFRYIGYFYFRIWDFVKNLGWYQFTILGTILGLLGIFSYRKRDKDIHVFLLLLLLCGGLVFVFLSNTPNDVVNMITLRRFYIIGILFFSLFIGLGFENMLERHRFSIILFLLPIGLLFFHYPQVNLRDYHYAYDLGDNILKSLPENAILFAGDDTPTFEVWYLQYVEGKRTDVTVIPAGNKDIIKNLAWKNIKIPDYDNLSLDDLSKKYPIYSASASEFFWGKKNQFLIPEGLVYHYTQNPDWIKDFNSDVADENFNKYITRGVYEMSMVDDPTKNILVNYLNAYINVGIGLQGSKKSNQAMKYYQEALKINPYSEIALINLASTYYETGDYEKAKEEYLNLLKLFPDSPQVRKGYDLTEQKLRAP